MMKLKSPKVIRIAGRVSSLRSEPMKVLIKPKRSATHTYFQKPPMMVIPGRSTVATQNARAKIAQRTRSFML